MNASASRPKIALVGDYSPDVPAHLAIPRAFELIRAAGGGEIAWHWIPTPEVRDPARELGEFAGMWLVPASPYRSMAGALAAVRWARENRRPFLGTCGGFQHALIEFARHVAGIAAAEHEESNPNASDLLVTRLSCSLFDQTAPLHFARGSLIARAYGRDTAQEAYRCAFGPNPQYRALLEATGLRFTAFDDDGAIRAAELAETAHPFFVGTLFQPERAALRGTIPPLAQAFVRATLDFHAAKQSVT